MDSTWQFDLGTTHTPRVKTVVDHAEQERNRMTKINELVQAFANQATKELPPLSASKVLSALFRQRGVPSLDTFTRLVGSFRKALGVRPGCRRSQAQVHAADQVEGVERHHYEHGHQGKQHQREIRLRELLLAAGLDQTHVHGHPLHVGQGGQRDQRQVGQLVGMEGRVRDGVGAMDGLRVLHAQHELNPIRVHVKCHQYQDDPLGGHAQDDINDYKLVRECGLSVTVSITTHGSTKMLTRLSAFINRNTSLRMFSNKSVQFCSSPTNIEVWFTAARTMVRRVANMNMEAILSSITQLKSPVA